MLHSDYYVPLSVCLDNFCVICVGDLEWLLGITVVLLCVDASIPPIYEAWGVPECTLMTQT